MKKKTTLNIQVEKTDKDLLVKIAKAEDKSVSAVVRTAIRGQYKNER